MLRILARSGSLGLANLVILAAAFAAAILLAALVRYELAFNAAIDPDGSVYQIYTRVTPPGREPSVTAGSVGDLAPAIRAARPGVVVGRMAQSPEREKITIGGYSTFETIFEADPEIADIFSFSVLQGDLAYTLSKPEGAVVTDGTAQKLFGLVDAVGAVFSLYGQPYRVGAVIARPPSNSSLSEVGVLVSSRGKATILRQMDEPGPVAAFTVGATRTLVRIEDTSADIAAVANRYTDAVISQMRQASGHHGVPAVTVEHLMIGLRDVEGAARAGAVPDPNRANSVLLISMSGLALLVVLVAVLNVINLSTALAAKRAGVVAVRKAFGASRSQLAISFMGETLVTALLSAALGLGLALLFGGWFSALVQRPLDLTLDVSSMSLLLGAAVLTGLAAGLYPALVLSGFRPALVLSARGVQAPGASLLRRVLVAVQVGISVATIALCGSVLLQLRHVTQTGLNFQAAGTVVYRLPKPVGAADPVLQALLAEPLNIPGVTQAAVAEALPTEGRTGSARVSGAGAAGLDLTTDAVSPGFLDALGIGLLAGRSFAPGELRSDKSGVATVRPIVVSRTTVQALGYSSPVNALSAIIRFGGARPWNGEIVGVMDDLPLGRLRTEHMPKVVLTTDIRAGRLLIVRLSGDADPETLRGLDALYARFFPDTLLDRFFLNERVAAAYADVGRMLGLVMFFGMLSAGASCLGVLGMSTALSDRMRREAGIRKAFGAPTLSIAFLLARRLAMPLVVGVTFGCLGGWLSAREWLLSFPSRADMGGLPELAAGALIVALAIVVLLWRVVDVARTRPAAALSYE